MDTPYLQWDDAFLIGVEELDYEHKDLFKRLNTLHAELVAHEKKELIEECLSGIHVRVAAHFALEEKYMRDTHFPHFTRHKNEHDQLLEEVVEIICRFAKTEDDAYRDRLADMLQRWIIRHIQSSDQELALGKEAYARLRASEGV